MSYLPSLCLTPENALASTEAHLLKCGLRVIARTPVREEWALRHSQPLPIVDSEITAFSPDTVSAHWRSQMLCLVLHKTHF